MGSYEKRHQEAAQPTPVHPATVQQQPVQTFYSKSGASHESSSGESSTADTTSPYVKLAGLARDKYQRFQRMGVPLENQHLQTVNKQNAGFMQDASMARSRNSAIHAIGAITPTAGAMGGSKARSLNRVAQSTGAAIAQGAREGANNQRNRAANMSVGAVNIGRGIQSTGSDMLKRSTGFELGNQIAEKNFRANNSSVQNQFVGNVAGAGVGVYGIKNGWFD